MDRRPKLVYQSSEAVWALIVNINLQKNWKNRTSVCPRLTPDCEWMLTFVLVPRHLTKAFLTWGNIEKGPLAVTSVLWVTYSFLSFVNACFSPFGRMHLRQSLRQRRFCRIFLVYLAANGCLKESERVFLRCNAVFQCTGSKTLFFSICSSQIMGTSKSLKTLVTMQSCVFHGCGWVSPRGQMLTLNPSKCLNPRQSYHTRDDLYFLRALRLNSIDFSGWLVQTPDISAWRNLIEVRFGSVVNDLDSSATLIISWEKHPFFLAKRNCLSVPFMTTQKWQKCNMKSDSSHWPRKQNENTNKRVRLITEQMDEEISHCTQLGMRVRECIHRYLHSLAVSHPW